MNKLYNRQVFHNNSAPALNETNLNILTKAVDDLDNRVIEMYISGDIEEIKQTAATVKSDKAAMESEIAEAKEDIQEIIDAGDLIVKADVALAKQYRDEAFETTPAGYEQVTAQVTTNKNDITNLKSALTNFNLIDNGWFTVNQRGAQSIPANGYGVDRWKNIYLNNGSIVVTSSGLKFNVGESTANCLIKQIIPKTDIDITKGYTLSVLMADGTIHSFSATTEHIETLPQFAYRLDTNDTNTYKVMIWAYSTITIRAIKLEYGSISTLANDHAPNYADELVRCQCSTADSSDTFANQTHNFITLSGTTSSNNTPSLSRLSYPSGFNVNNTMIVGFIWQTTDSGLWICGNDSVLAELRTEGLAIYSSGATETTSRPFKITIMKI